MLVILHGLEVIAHAEILDLASMEPHETALQVIATVQLASLEASVIL